jgi:predicted ATPase
MNTQSSKIQGRNADRCECTEPHPRRRIVLTGGPGAGKTAVLALVRQSFCEHIVVLPESASVVFGGGFPRSTALTSRQAAQRAIFYVQRELETEADARDPAITLCDRGTVDGAAYTDDSANLRQSVSTTLDEQLARYDVVIHLRTPSANQGYNHQNSLRTETATEAAAIDARIAAAWARHPRLVVVENEQDFLTKAARVIDLLRQEMPKCCKGHRVAGIDKGAR